MAFSPDDHKKAWAHKLSKKTQPVVMQTTTSALKHAVEEPETAKVMAPDIRNDKNALMDASIEVDISKLRSINSLTTRKERKADLLPKYQDFIDSTIKADDPRAEATIFNNMLWAIDLEEIERAIEIGVFAVKHEITTPERFSRDIANVFAGELSQWCLETQKAEKSAEPWLSQIVELTEEWDLVDAIRGELNRAQGQEIEETDPEQALAFYQEALKFNENAGVKPMITKLTKQLAEATPDKQEAQE